MQMLDRPLAEQGEREFDLLTVAVDVDHHPAPVSVSQLLGEQEPLLRTGGNTEIVDPRPDAPAAVRLPTANELLGLSKVILECFRVVFERRLG